MTEARQELKDLIRLNLMYTLPRFRWWAGMSIQDLAKASEVAAGRISDMENGRDEFPGPRTLVALSKALNCAVKDLIPLQSERP